MTTASRKTLIKRLDAVVKPALLHGSKIAMKRVSFPRRRESRKLKS
ncbi:hypothetical protein [Rickettsia endosymbiont of Ceutorhynchus obstrictus]